jgi:hypothetical protein
MGRLSPVKLAFTSLAILTPTLTTAIRPTIMPIFRGLESLNSFEDNVFHNGPPGHDQQYDGLLATHVESFIVHVRYVHATGIKIKTPDLKVLRPHFG